MPEIEARDRTVVPLRVINIQRVVGQVFGVRVSHSGEELPTGMPHAHFYCVPVLALLGLQLADGRIAGKRTVLHCSRGSDRGLVVVGTVHTGVDSRIEVKALIGERLVYVECVYLVARL